MSLSLVLFILSTKYKLINYYLELACRDQDRQAPFERISADPSEFIDAEYMPTDISITDPRSMKLETLLKFFKHIAEREASHGIPNALMSRLHV